MSLEATVSLFGHLGKGLTVVLMLRSAAGASFIFEPQAKELDTNAW